MEFIKMKSKEISRSEKAFAGGLMVVLVLILVAMSWPAFAQTSRGPASSNQQELKQKERLSDELVKVCLTTDEGKKAKDPKFCQCFVRNNITLAFKNKTEKERIGQLNWVKNAIAKKMACFKPFLSTFSSVNGPSLRARCLRASPSIQYSILRNTSSINTDCGHAQPQNNRPKTAVNRTIKTINVSMARANK